MGGWWEGCLNYNYSLVAINSGGTGSGGLEAKVEKGSLKSNIGTRKYSNTILY